MLLAIRNNAHKLNRHALWPLHVVAILNGLLALGILGYMNLDGEIRVRAIQPRLDAVIVCVGLCPGYKGLCGGRIHVIVAAVTAKLGHYVNVSHFCLRARCM